MNYNRHELSGAFADIGVLFPIVVGLIAVNHVNPVVSLGLCGLFYIITSLYYKVPVPVQPLKVFCTVALAVNAPPNLMQAGAFLIGIAFIILSIPQVMVVIKRLFPIPIIRGIQLGTGLLLIESGIRLMKSPAVLIGGPREQIILLGQTVPVSIFFGCVAALLLLTSLRSSKYPAGLVLIGFGIVVAVLSGAKIMPDSMQMIRSGNSGLGFLVIDNLTAALWLLVIPQIPLSVGNAIVATESTLKTYFGDKAEKVNASKLSLGMGLFNMLSGVMGGIPCCHGCGGVTAHYRLGARTGTATFITGIFYMGLAVSVLFLGTTVFSFFPYPILGVFLLYVGLEHALLIKDITMRQDLLIVILIGSIAFVAKDMTIAFIVGMVFRYILLRMKILH